jgi:hypothetical protein
MKINKLLLLLVVTTFGFQNVNAAIRLDMEAMSVVGNQELPKVIYLMAWKRSPKGDVLQQSLESLHNSEMMPIDRDVFRRQMEYYERMNGK